MVTGVRFNRHKNTIYLELQQGKLENGKIDPITVKWKISNKCNNSKKVINFRGSSYDGLKIILEDIIFPENKIVTGYFLIILLIKFMKRIIINYKTADYKKILKKIL